MKRSKVSMQERERRFVDAYYGDAEQCGTKAARMAGYLGGDKKMAEMARRLLRRASVQAIIHARLNQIDATPAKVFQLLELHRTADIMDVFSVDERGNVRLDLCKAVRNRRTGVVQGLKVKTRTYTMMQGQTPVEVAEQQVEVKLHNSQTAAVELGKLQGLYIERHQTVKGEGDRLPRTMEEAIDRLLRMRKPISEWPRPMRDRYTLFVKSREVSSNAGTPQPAPARESGVGNRSENPAGPQKSIADGGGGGGAVPPAE